MTGLHLKHKNNLCQLLSEDFYRYYSLASHTIYWNVQITQTFLTIIQNFAFFALEILQFSQNWLFTHHFSFRLLNNKNKHERSKKPNPEKRSKSALRNSEKSKSPEKDQNYKKKLHIWSYLIEQNQPKFETQQQTEEPEEPEGRQKRLYLRSRSKAFRLSKQSSPPRTIFEETKIDIAPLKLENLHRKQKSEEEEEEDQDNFIDDKFKFSLLLSQNSPEPVRLISPQLDLLTQESAKREGNEFRLTLAENDLQQKEQFQFERKALQRRLTNEKEKLAQSNSINNVSLYNSNSQLRTQEGGSQTKREKREAAINQLEEMRKLNEKAWEHEKEMLEGVLNGNLTNETFNRKLKKLQSITSPSKKELELELDEDEEDADNNTKELNQHESSF